MRNIILTIYCLLSKLAATPTPVPTLDDLAALLPYQVCTNSHEQDAQNTVALVWFAKHMPRTHGSVARQVKLYEDLNNPEPCGYCGTSQNPNDICITCFTNLS